MSLPGVVVWDRPSQLLSAALKIISCVDHSSSFQALLADGVR